MPPTRKPPKLEILITCDSDTTLWGLSGRQRLQKQFAHFPRLVLLENLSQRENNCPLLLIRGDFVYVQKLINALVANENECVLMDDANHAPLAIYLTQTDCSEDIIQQLNAGVVAESMNVLSATEFVQPYDESLRKYERVEIYKIEAEKKAQLEKFLFGSAYKGVTDFVTKFIWPKPAEAVTRFCTRRGITPNQVTLVGSLLVIVAGFLFWHAWFLSGLLLGWCMTFLDTVDGKLARVTISSSKTGHVMDHGMDIIHPPVWYFAWGMGLLSLGFIDATFELLMWSMFIAYLGGRIVEGIVELFTPISIFTWRRFDSFHRLVTARRNPNMVLLTYFTVIGQPAYGLYAVILWHVLSTVLLLIRFVQLLQHKNSGQPVDSWLAHIDATDVKPDLASRLFAKHTAVK